MRGSSPPFLVQPICEFRARQGFQEVALVSFQKSCASAGFASFFPRERGGVETLCMARTMSSPMMLHFLS